MRQGIDPQRLEIVGFGEFHPRQPNDTAEGRNANRRVAILVLEDLSQEGSSPASRVETAGAGPAAGCSPAPHRLLRPPQRATRSTHRPRPTTPCWSRPGRRRSRRRRSTSVRSNSCGPAPIPVRPGLRPRCEARMTVTHERSRPLEQFRPVPALPISDKRKDSGSPGQPPPVAATRHPTPRAAPIPIRMHPESPKSIIDEYA